MTNTQAHLYWQARHFAESELAPFAGDWDRHKVLPTETLQYAGKLGFGGLFVGHEYGGSHFGLLDTVGIYEALAGGCTSTTAYLTIQNALAWLLYQFGTCEQKQTWLSHIVNMESLCSFCLTEPDAGSDAKSIRTRANFHNGVYIINGTKAFISGAGQSDLYFVVARLDDGTMACFLVPHDTDGVSFGINEEKMGWNTHPTRHVYFDDCKVDQTQLLSGLDPLAHMYGGRITIASCSLGAAQHCLESTIKHLNERVQFGRPLARHQSVQFQVAEMTTRLLRSRLLVRQAAYLYDNNHPEAFAYSAIAKQQATDDGLWICDQCLQLHGGYGYLRDTNIERYVRDVRVHCIVEGANEVMKWVVGRAVLS